MRQLALGQQRAAFSPQAIPSYRALEKFLSVQPGPFTEERDRSRHHSAPRRPTAEGKRAGRSCDGVEHWDRAVRRTVRVGRPEFTCG